MEKKNLNKDTIAEATLELLHEKGLAHVTMRNVAAKLKVKAPALYWYIKNKQELLQLISDIICSRIKLPNQMDNWEEEIIQLSLETRKAMLSVPDGAEIMMDTLPTTKTRLHIIDKTLEIFYRANFPADKIFMIVTLFNNYVTSFVLDEQKQQKMLDQIGMEEVFKQFTNALSEIPIEEAPYVHHHMQSQNDKINNEDSFLAGLRIILKGIKAESSK